MMTSALGSRIRSLRQARGLNPQAFARALGYRNANKGARRLLALEQNGLEHPEFVERVLRFLELDRDSARALYQDDERARRAAWEAWADQPVRPCLLRGEGPLFIRALAPIKVPETVSSAADAERFARDYAREHRMKLQLLLSRREEVRLDRDGQITARITHSYEAPLVPPTLSVAGQAFRFEAEAAVDHRSDNGDTRFSK